jgi:hypothetical protein
VQPKSQSPNVVNAPAGTSSYQTRGTEQRGSSLKKEQKGSDGGGLFSLFWPF